MKKSIILSVLLLSPALAGANEGKNYFSISGDYIAKADSDASFAVGGVGASGDVSYDNGFGVSGAIGRYLTNNFRVDGELSYKHINADKLTINGTTYDVSSIDAKIISTMANATFELPAQGKATPYIGAGLGWAHETEEGGNALAYQIRAGVDYKLNDVSSVYGGYHYYGTTDFEYNYNVAGLGNVKEEFNLNTHAIEIGFRRTF